MLDPLRQDRIVHALDDLTEDGTCLLSNLVDERLAYDGVLRRLAVAVPLWVLGDHLGTELQLHPLWTGCLVPRFAPHRPHCGVVRLLSHFLLVLIRLHMSIRLGLILLPHLEHPRFDLFGFVRMREKVLLTIRFGLLRQSGLGRCMGLTHKGGPHPLSLLLIVRLPRRRIPIQSLLDILLLHLSNPRVDLFGFVRMREKILLSIRFNSPSLLPQGGGGWTHKVVPHPTSPLLKGSVQNTQLGLCLLLGHALLAVGLPRRHRNDDPSAGSLGDLSEFVRHFII